MSTLVYIHGTNGSGKSTLARAVITAAGGRINYLISANELTKHSNTHTKRNVALIGSYRNSCGGVDGVQPYALVHELMQRAIKHKMNAFAEGLVTPGVDTCVKFASYFDQAVFILLDTPDTVCIKNVLKRRATKGTTKPYDPKNLYRKQASAKSWADRLERAGLNVQRLQYRQAYTTTLELLGLSEPSVDDLLS